MASQCHVRRLQTVAMMGNQRLRSTIGTSALDIMRMLVSLRFVCLGTWRGSDSYLRMAVIGKIVLWWTNFVGISFWMLVVLMLFQSKLRQCASACTASRGPVPTAPGTRKCQSVISRLCGASTAKDIKSIRDTADRDSAMIFWQLVSRSR